MLKGASPVTLASVLGRKSAPMEIVWPLAPDTVKAPLSVKWSDFRSPGGRVYSSESPKSPRLGFNWAVTGPLSGCRQVDWSSVQSLAVIPATGCVPVDFG